MHSSCTKHSHGAHVLNPQNSMQRARARGQRFWPAVSASGEILREVVEICRSTTVKQKQVV